MDPERDLPRIRTAERTELIPGALVLEGGGCRGVYTAGVCDVLMENGIHFQGIAGISAGALNGVHCLARQIGRTAVINIAHIRDPRLIGWRTLYRDFGLMGFRFMFRDAMKLYPFDPALLEDPSRRLAIGVTDLGTGEEVYLEGGGADAVCRAAAASSSLPCISRIAKLGGRKYLDGGCAVPVPLDWALEQGYSRIVTVLTDERSVRRTPRDLSRVKRRYRRYPAFLQALERGADVYNAMRERIAALEEQGRIFVIAPETPPEAGILERDPDRLLAFYRLGRADMEKRLPALREYLQG